MPHLRHFKNAWVFGLGLLLAFQAAGWYISWGVLMLDAKITATRKLAQPLAAPQQLTVATQDFTSMWVGKREIRYGGRLYDVRRQTPQGDSVRLEIYHDIQEEALLHQLFDLLATEEDATKSPFQWLCQLMEASYLVPMLPELPFWQSRYERPDFTYLLNGAQHEPAHSGIPPKS